MTRRLIPSMAWLAAFEASARHLSYTQAGKELSLTQGAVSRHVQSLEEMLGVSLFQRDGRQIELTKTGETYFREIQGAVQQIRNASLHTIALRDGGASVKLKAPPEFDVKWLAPRLAGFHHRYPEILVNVFPYAVAFDIERSEVEIERGEFDAAIGLCNSRCPSLSSHHLFDEVVIPVISPRLLANQAFASPAGIQDQILLETSARPELWERWFEKYCDTPYGMPRGPRFELVLHTIQAAVSGLGVALLPSCFVEEELRSGTLITPFNAPLTTGFCYKLFSRSGRGRSQSVGLLAEWLSANKENQGPSKTLTALANPY